MHAFKRVVPYRERMPPRCMSSRKVRSLRIIDDALWQRVKMRQENLRAG